MKFFIFNKKHPPPPPLLTNNLFSKNIWNSIKREENMKWYLFIYFWQQTRYIINMALGYESTSVNVPGS